MAEMIHTDNGRAFASKRITGGVDSHFRFKVNDDWIARRHEVIAAAIAFLKARCILVDVLDRDALVRRYRVSGKRDSQMLEDVVEYAESLGFEVPA